MQTDEQKIAEINKLNKAQRKTMKSLWGQPIDMIIVKDVLENCYPSVQVRNVKHQWLSVELGPRGAVHHKRYDQL